jgi:hypothetical protein
MSGRKVVCCLAALAAVGAVCADSTTVYRTKGWYRVDCLTIAAGWPPVGAEVAGIAVGLPPPFGLGIGLRFADAQIQPDNPGGGLFALSGYYVAHAAWDDRNQARQVTYAEGLVGVMTDGPYLRGGLAADWRYARLSWPLMLGIRAGVYRVYDGWNGVWRPLGFYAQVQAGLDQWRRLGVRPAPKLP